MLTGSRRWKAAYPGASVGVLAIRGAALIQAMFMAELKNLLLTAGHDLEAVRGDLGVAAATGTETYQLLDGQQHALQPGDMFIQDQVGILSSIIHGPDQRTRITPDTTHVLFTVYAPAGISEDRVREHLTDLGDLVGTVSSSAEVELAEVVTAGTGG